MKMHQVMFGTKAENIFVYGTTIHKLLKELFPERMIDEDMDVIAVLRNMVDDKNRELLSNRYSDIILVFDFDMHDPRFDMDLLMLATRFFDNSTVRGKLYLNYPMMESYKHLKSEFDEDYLKRTVSVDCGSSYKGLVDQECCDSLKYPEKYTVSIFRRLSFYNLRKTNYILSGSDRVPSEEEYLGWTSDSILEKQMKLIDSSHEMYVLNTLMLYPVDYNLSMFIGFSSDVITGEEVLGRCIGMASRRFGCSMGRKIE